MSKFTSFFSVLAVTLAFQACSPKRDSDPVSETANLKQLVLEPFLKVNYVISGGGAAVYSLERRGAPSEYSISVRTAETGGQIKMALVIDSSNKYYSLADRMIRGNISVSEGAASDLPTGSWRTIKFYSQKNGVVQVIARPVFSNKADELSYQEMLQWAQESADACAGCIFN